MTKDPSLSQLLQMAGRQVSGQISVSQPGTVTGYDHSTQKASVRPIIKRGYSDGREDVQPVIHEVPVIFPRSSGASLTFPVTPGDTVLLVFSDIALERWLADGKERGPGDLRQHALTDAVAIPGLIPFSTGSLAENNEDVLLTFEGSQVRLTGGGDIELDTGGKVKINAVDKVEVTAPDIELTGQAKITLTAPQIGIAAEQSTVTGTFNLSGGDIIADDVSLKEHVHEGVSSGSEETGLPVPGGGNGGA